MEVSTILILPSLFILAASATAMISVPLCHLLKRSKPDPQEYEEGSDLSTEEESEEGTEEGSDLSTEDESEEGTEEESDITGSCSEVSETTPSEEEDSSESDSDDDDKYMDVEYDESSERGSRSESCNAKTEELIVELAKEVSKMKINIFMTFETEAPNENWVRLVNKESLAEIFRIVKIKYKIH